MSCTMAELAKRRILASHVVCEDTGKSAACAPCPDSSRPRLDLASLTVVGRESNLIVCDCLCNSIEYSCNEIN